MYVYPKPHAEREIRSLLVFGPDANHFSSLLFAWKVNQEKFKL